MKEIYIVLTHTGTTLSSIVKFYTKKKYTHVSIGLDSELKELYSFGRLNPYNAFIGGFVHEELNKGTFARFKNTIGAVYSLKVTDEQYNSIVKNIEYVKENKDKYKFNIIILFLISINKKYQKKDTFYCAEFVKHILETSFNKKLLPEIIKPMDFLELENIELIYKGLFSKYQHIDNPYFQEDIEADANISRTNSNIRCKLATYKRKIINNTSGNGIMQRTIINRNSESNEQKQSIRWNKINKILINFINIKIKHNL